MCQNRQESTTESDFIFVVEYVSGVTCLDNNLYVIYRLSNTIRVFTGDLYKEVRAIKVDGMRFPLDIVACRDSRQLYVADSGSDPAEECIWRVSAVHPGQYVKWLTVGQFSVQSLSMTASGLLVVSPTSLHQYSMTDAQLTRAIPLPNYVRCVFHGVETKRGTFVIGHRGRETSEMHAAVSQLYDQ